MNCPICGTQIPDGTDFCPQCGPSRPEPETAAPTAPYAPDEGSMQDAGKGPDGPAAPETDVPAPADAGFFGEPEQSAPGADADARNNSRVPPNGDHGFPPPPPGEGYPGGLYGQRPIDTNAPYVYLAQEPEAAKTAQVLSIVGLSMGSMSIMNILSLILCIIGLHKAKESRKMTGGVYCASAKTASVCSYIGIVLSVRNILFFVFYFIFLFFLIFTAIGVNNLPDAFNSFGNGLTILFS
ncbi:MAG: hypothetical protein IJK02_05010 [Clostridia bacterium]|nr:hypothetical protein [Clostridia bacterium]